MFASYWFFRKCVRVWINIVHLNPFVENRDELISDSSLYSILSVFSLCLIRVSQLSFIHLELYVEDRFFICMTLLVFPMCFRQKSVFSLYHTLILILYILQHNNSNSHFHLCLTDELKSFAIGIYNNELFQDNFYF